MQSVKLSLNESVSIMKIVVGLSGGVDSSVTAVLLQKQRSRSHRTFMRNWNDSFRNFKMNVLGLRHNDALFSGQKLGIPFQVIDMSKLYKERIVDYMFAEYEKENSQS